MTNYKAGYLAFAVDRRNQKTRVVRIYFVCERCKLQATQNLIVEIMLLVEKKQTHVGGVGVFLGADNNFRFSFSFAVAAAGVAQRSHNIRSLIYTIKSRVRCQQRVHVHSMLFVRHTTRKAHVNIINAAAARALARPPIAAEQAGKMIACAVFLLHLFSCVS